MGYISFSQYEVEEGITGKGSRTLWVPHSSTHLACLAQFCLCVDPGSGSLPLFAAAYLSSFSPQTQAPPCLQTPQPQAQAQSPLCLLHNEEPASQPSLPLTPHGDHGSRNSPSPVLGPSPNLEISSLRKESSSCPSTAPIMPGRGMHFYIGLFKDFCLKDFVSNIWERG